jgi:hypothetical protein
MYGAAFEQPLVAEVDRHEHERTARLAQVAAHGHRQHARARLQQPARAAAAALDEILDRMTTRHHEPDVLHEHRGVERVSGKRAPQEERAAAAQERAEQRHVQVDACAMCGTACPL